MQCPAFGSLPELQKATRIWLYSTRDGEATISLLPHLSCFLYSIGEAVYSYGLHLLIVAILSIR